MVKTTGDGVLARFDGPARGIQCASAIVDAAGRLDLRVRAGLHVGECLLRGDDLAGIAVHIGARISALARAGEVYVSSTVRDLVAGSGIAFDDRGRHSLKGVPGDWQVLAVASSPDQSPGLPKSCSEHLGRPFRPGGGSLWCAPHSVVGSRTRH